jgi:ribosomal protein S27AE
MENLENQETEKLGYYHNPVVRINERCPACGHDRVVEGHCDLETGGCGQLIP